MVRHRGSLAEDLAAQHLMAQGLTLLQRNYRCRMGEIDLIFEQGPRLVFVEVRHRSRSHFGGALESIDARKQQRLLRTAQHYLLCRQSAAKRPCRFDAVILSGPLEQPAIEWIQDAFQA